MRSATALLSTVALDNPVAIATGLISQGIPVFPVNPLNKQPLTKHGFHDATTDPASVAEWWSQNPNAMIGVPTGKPSGMFALDVDVKNGKDGAATLRALEAEYGPLPPTRTVRSASGGYHIFFKMPQSEIRSSAGFLGEGVDHRADGGYIVWAGSVDAQGRSYEEVTTGPLADPPQWLLDLLQSARLRTSSVALVDGKIPDGRRNSTLTSVAGAIRRRGLSEAVIRSALRSVNSDCCDPPLPEPEVDSISASIGHRDRQYSKTNTGNGERFRDVHGVHVRHSSKEGFRVWDGKRWELDECGAVYERAKDIAQTMLEEALALPESDNNEAKRKKAAIKFAHRTLDFPERMVDKAKTDPAIAVMTDAFDKQKYLFNCQNGVIDLHTGELQPHDSSRLVTKISPVNYVPDALAPLWQKFLHRIMDGDQEMVDFLARLFGMALTGDAREHVMAILWGSGRNGKSRFTEAIFRVLGDYGDIVRQEALMMGRQQGIPTDIADMRGARLILANETPEGKRLDGNLIKELTGGETVKGRQLYQRAIKFRPEALITLVTNWKPMIQGADTALVSRLKLIRFGVTIPAAERDTTLGEKLRAESEGILVWLVRGCLEWERAGLRTPKKVIEETDSYRSDMDLLSQFVEEYCEEGPDPQGQPQEARSSTLFKRYQSYVIGHGERPPSQRGFTALMDRRYKRLKKRDGMFFVGIKLRSVGNGVM